MRRVRTPACNVSAGPARGQPAPRHRERPRVCPFATQEGNTTTQQCNRGTPKQTRAAPTAGDRAVRIHHTPHARIRHTPKGHRATHTPHHVHATEAALLYANNANSLATTVVARRLVGRGLCTSPERLLQPRQLRARVGDLLRPSALVHKRARAWPRCDGARTDCHGSTPLTPAVLGGLCQPAPRACGLAAVFENNTSASVA